MPDDDFNGGANSMHLYHMRVYRKARDNRAISNLSLSVCLYLPIVVDGSIIAHAVSTVYIYICIYIYALHKGIYKTLCNGQQLFCVVIITVVVVQTC